MVDLCDAGMQHRLGIRRNRHLSVEDAVTNLILLALVAWTGDWRFW
jgi:hypothetical protein